MDNVAKNVLKLVAPANYNVSYDVDIIEVDTSSGGITNINLQKIFISYGRKTLYISDRSNNASRGNIIINTTGGNLVNNNSSLVLSVDGIVAEVNVADTNRFIANLSTDEATPPPVSGDKNFVMNQNVSAVLWSVPHNLNKRCAVQVLDNSFNEIEAEIHWVNDNEVEVRFNKPKVGWVYCN